MSKITDEVKSAAKILHILIGGGEINRTINKEYFNLYKESGVSEYLGAMCEGMNLKLYEYKDGLYVSPGINNTVFGYSNEILKQNKFKRYQNPELHLTYFIIIVIITMFYRESDSDTYITRIKIPDILDKVEEKISSLKTRNLSELSQKESYNFEDIVTKWDSLPLKTTREDNQLSERGKDDKYALIHSICDFLEKEGLVKKDSNMNTILPQNRMKAIVDGYFQDVDSRNELYELIDQLGKSEDNECQE